MMPDVNIDARFSKSRAVLRNATQSELVNTVRLYSLLVSLYLSVSSTLCIKFRQSEFDDHGSSEAEESSLSNVTSSVPLSKAVWLELCTLIRSLSDKFSAGDPSMVSLLDCCVIRNKFFR